MKKQGLVLCGFLGLVGCMVSQPNLEANAPKDDAQCQAMNYKLGTEGYLQCRQLLMNQHIADAKARGAAASDIHDRLERASAALAAVSPPPPTVTNCQPFGQGMTCTTQ